LNKTEQRALGWMKRSYPTSIIRVHALTLAIGSGCRYTPEFTVHSPVWDPKYRTMLWEVKGPHIWEDSIVKIKAAAQQWPMFEFRLMWESPGLSRGWAFQIILP
jgi:hypothetical protein